MLRVDRQIGLRLVFRFFAYNLLILYIFII